MSYRVVSLELRVVIIQECAEGAAYDHAVQSQEPSTTTRYDAAEKHCFRRTVCVVYVIIIVIIIIIIIIIITTTITTTTTTTTILNR